MSAPANSMPNENRVNRGQLSDLQRQILERARVGRERKRRAGREDRVDVWCCELMHDVLGFPTGSPLYDDAGLLRGFPSDARFDPDEIGRGRYRVARVSLSRAIRRLERRGLVLVWTPGLGSGCGVSLTEAP